MIDLQLLAEFASGGAPFVVKVSDGPPRIGDYPAAANGDVAVVSERSDGRYLLQSAFGDFSVFVNDQDSIDGDVLLCFPDRGKVQRLYRRASKHNTILFTERCDQLCVMCSQPPKNKDYRWLFTHYEKALTLLDRDVMIGISGGEPTLYKDELLGMIERVGRVRPDVSYHILTNGQHFSVEDVGRLRDIHDLVHIMWGVPLYSHIQETHDEIVGKEGSYNQVMENLLLLGGAKADIELRTVIMARNYLDIPHLATFIARHLPFIADWVLMGLEPIGYAKANKDQLFIDHSAFPEPLMSAIDIAEVHGIPCHLYNIPLCTMPETYRDRCVDSISDWKKKYLPQCEGCRIKDDCCGFFEWYNDRWTWSQVHPQL